MNTFKAFGLCACAALMAAGAGCSKESEPARTAHHETRETRMPVAHHEPLTPRGERMTPASRTRSAAEQIAQARCERERQCGNIGADKTFSSSQDCLARIQNDWRDDLDARKCPGGIDQHELNECLEQIRSEACANPFDTLARVTECTSRQICVEKR